MNEIFLRNIFNIIPNLLLALISGLHKYLNGRRFESIYIRLFQYAF